MKLQSLILAASILAISATEASGQAAAKVRRCIQQDHKMVEVEVNYNTQTGDYTAIDINGVERLADEVYPTDDTYAANAKWYIDNKQIKAKGATYVKYGLPRILGVNEVKYTATYYGVPVYAEDANHARPDVVYIPVRTGCEFQPYQLAAK